MVRNYEQPAAVSFFPFLKPLTNDIYQFRLKCEYAWAVRLARRVGQNVKKVFVDVAYRLSTSLSQQHSYDVQ